MKKAAVFGIIVAVAAFAAASFAAAQAPAPAMAQPMSQGIMMDATQMQTMHKEMSAQMVKSGVMTAEQAKGMDERMTKMAENGGMMGMMGQGGMSACPGLGQQSKQ